MKTLLITVIALFTAPTAKADFAYYSLDCTLDGMSGAFTTVAQFANKTVQLNGQNTVVPAVTGMIVSFQGIPCAWATNAPNPAPRGTPVPPQIAASVAQWTMQETVLFGNGSTTQGGTTFSPVGWSIPLKKKFRVQVTPDPAFLGHVKDGTFPQILN
jgi:hypothetical protein